MTTKLEQFLIENENTLVSPELIGTNEEKITALHWWMEGVTLLRSMTAVTSIANKFQLLDSLNKELELVKIELENASAIVRNDKKDIPSMEQPDPNTDSEKVVDLATDNKLGAATKANGEVPKIDTTQGAPGLVLTKEDVERMRRAAGLFPKYHKSPV
jgi:hypothetical protein